MHFVALVSMVANMATVVAVGAFVASGLRLEHKAIQDVTELTWFKLHGLPTSTGIINFCFVAHGVFPTVYQSMSDAKSGFGKALNVSYVAAFVAYAGSGLFGYMTYGEAVANPFTINVGHDQSGVPLRGMGKLQDLVNLSTIIKLEGQFPLFFAPIILATQKWIKLKSRTAIFSWKIFVLVVTTLIAIAASDNIAEVQTITGCAFVMATCLSLPVAFYLKLFSQNLSRLKKVALSILLVVGLMVQVLGTTAGIVQLFR
eukprot:Selendium_serpulae@DN5919_c0_g1_i10.p2